MNRNNENKPQYRIWTYIIALVIAVVALILWSYLAQNRNELTNIGNNIDIQLTQNVRNFDNTIE